MSQLGVAAAAGGHGRQDCRQAIALSGPPAVQSSDTLDTAQTFYNASAGFKNRKEKVTQAVKEVENCFFVLFFFCLPLPSEPAILPFA